MAFRRRWWRGSLMMVGIAAGVLGTSLAACGDKAESEASYINRGKELAAKGDLAGADVLLRNALQINPKSAEALYLLAVNAERRGDMPNAYRLYVRVTEEKPDHVSAHAKVGQIYAAGGDLARAREQAAIAEKLDPEHFEVILLQGVIAFRANEFDRAAERARTVLAKDPANVDASGLLARILEEQGRLNEAIAVYEAALAAKPDATQLRIMKTKALVRGDRWQEAVASFQDLIAREPKVYDHRLSMARAYELRRDFAGAERVLNEAIAAGVGGSRPKLELVDMLERQNKWEAAEAELVRLASAASEEYPLQFRLADHYFRTDRQAEAKAVLEGVVRRDADGPNGITARSALARIALREGDGARVDQLLAEILKLEPANGDALLMRAGRLLERREAEAAIIDLRTVLRDSPQNADAKRLLANAYFMAGKNDLAEKQLASLIEQNAADPSVKYDLAYLQARRGASNEAIALLGEVAEEAPAAVAPLRAKALMMIAERQFAGAEETIRRIAEMPGQQQLADMLHGVLYLASDRPKEAVGAFRRAHERAPMATAPVNGVVRAYLRQGDVDGALAFVRKLIADHPDSAYLHNGYGELLLLAGKREEAIAALEKARAKAPEWPMAYFNLSRAYVAKGDPGRGLEVLNVGLQRVPADPLLLHAKADTLLLRGQHRESLAVYLELLEINPDDHNAANNAAALIADFYYQDEAALRRAVELAKRFENATSPNYLDTLGWVRYRAGELELARAALTRAARRLPDDPQIQYHLGMVKFALGDREGARAALDKATAVSGAAYPGVDEARETLRELAAGGTATTIRHQ